MGVGVLVFSVSHMPPPRGGVLSQSLRDYLDLHGNSVIRITKPVALDDIGALSAQVDDPILFENLPQRPGFRLTDILVKNRENQGRALGVSRDDYLRTLAYRLRLPPRPFKMVKEAPVKEVKWLGADIDLGKLPIPVHKEGDTKPYITCTNILRDPETGFYNSNNAGTTVIGPRTGLISFVTPHSRIIMQKYREMGETRMPIALMVGVPPAYEIMANYSGLHLDVWGEMEMVGTIMDQDIEMVPAPSPPVEAR